MQKLALLQRQLQGRYNQILTPEQQQQLMSARQKQSVDAEINRWMDDVASTANLDPGQKAQIRTLVTAAVTRANAIGNNASIPQAQRASQLRKIQQSTDASIKKILTPEQEKTMQQTEKQRTIEGIVHGPLQVLDETVSLTADQRQQVKGILQQSAQQALALQQSSASPDKRDAAYRSITESTEKQIRRLLTPNQQAAWDQRQQDEARALQVDGPLNSIDAAVSLTAAQKARVQKLLEKAAQQTKDVGADDSLSASDRIARLNKITQATNAAIKQVLTASQRAKLNSGD
jgi:Spy/CpxP family protein refolding chaperone